MLNTGLDLLIKTKVVLEKPNAAGRASLVQDLYQIASFAESFAEQRPRSNKEWVHLADTLDQEGSYVFAAISDNQSSMHNPGVNLWNISGVIRQIPDDDGRTLVGARTFLVISFENSLSLFVIVRLAAFRMIEGSLEHKPPIESPSIFPILMSLG
jgi:hypothetical protein